MNFFDNSILSLFPKFKATHLPKLAYSTKCLIRGGRASLYSCTVTLVPDAKYWLRVPGRPTCGCGHSDEWHSYLLDENGSIITEVPEGMKPEVIAVVRLEEE